MYTVIMGRMHSIKQLLIIRHFSSKSYDIAIVGGGIVGTATAREILCRNTSLRCVLIEKENELGLHQSSHNSGVIHAGIYYKPGSIRAKLCTEGMDLMYKYLEEKRIPYKKVGKLIVATCEEEVKTLNELYNRGLKNNVKDLSMVSSNEINAIEPHCVVLYAGFLLTCAGLYSDKVALMSGGAKNPAIIPFRGEYLVLKPEKQHLIKGNIYPVPDTRFPFLGVHFTPKLDGNVWLGPNAVLALKREGYRYSDISIQDMWNMINYKGLHKIASKYFLYGVKEQMKSIFLKLHVEELKKFVPVIEVKDVSRGPSGVRAQAVSVVGELVEDFTFDEGDNSRIIHCRNTPSPAATSSLAIGKVLADKMLYVAKKY